MKKTFIVLLLLMSSFLYGASDDDEKVKNSYGIEVNPFRLFSYGSEWQTFAGTFSCFHNDEGVEIAFPVFYSRKQTMNFNHDDTDTLFTFDIHYRKYFEEHKTQGAYWGVFGRYAYLDGKVDAEPLYASVHKFGVGFEVGVRVKRLFDYPLYWGVSIAIGKYLFGRNRVFSPNATAANEDSEVILDGEILKIGYEF